MLKGQVQPVRVSLDTKYGLLRKHEDARGVTSFIYSRMNEIDDSELAIPGDVKVLTRAQLKQASGGG
jgi:hypothetical protein